MEVGAGAGAVELVAAVKVVAAVVLAEADGAVADTDLAMAVAA